MSDHDENGRRILGRSTDAPGGKPLPPNTSTPRPVIGRSSSARALSTPSVLSDVPSQVPRDKVSTGSRRRRRTSQRLIRLGAIIAVIAVLVPCCAFFFGWWQYSKIPTVEISTFAPQNGARTGTNYLIVGTDSRSGISASDPNAGAFLAESVSGSRTDTIMVLHVDGSTIELASIPRDLWVTDPATRQKGRINSTFAAGPSNLVAAVESLGIPIDEYLEINFVSFAKLVDAVGGITLDVPYPARDDHSGLSITQAGATRLNGSQALAYVRSRYYEEFVDGKWRVDGTADLGRTERQRAFFAALLHRLTADRNPLHLFTVPGSIGTGLRHSSNLSYLDALRLLWVLRDGAPQPVVLPVSPRRTSGGADVLELQPNASDVIASLAT